jgi:putative phage-type endonuclease
MDINVLIDRFYNHLKNGRDVIKNVSDMTKIASCQPVLLSDIINRLNKYVEWKVHIERLKEIPQPIQKSEEWLMKRNNMITASDFAQALGKGKFGTQKDFIIKKVDLPAFNCSIPPLIWGIKYEPCAAMIYQLRNKVILHEFGLIPHPIYPIIGASPDGITENGIMLEIKCPWRRKIVEGVIPEQYLWQMQVQLDVCQLEECDYIECVFKEYENEEEFLKDSADPYIMRTLQGNEKGIIIEVINTDNSKTYEYFQLNESINIIDALNWAKERLNLLENSKVIYWKLEKMQSIRVYKDRLFMDKYMPDINEVWAKVIHYRNNRDIYVKEVLHKKNSRCLLSSDDE